MAVENDSIRLGARLRAPVDLDPVDPAAFSAVELGLGRIADLYYRSSTLYQIHYM